jgi:hypothetical protein
MQRLLLAAAVSVVVLGVAGCSTGNSATGNSAAGADAPVAIPQTAPGAGAPSSAPAPAGASPNAGDKALSGSTKAICDQALKTNGQYGEMFTQDQKLLTAAASAQGTDVTAQVKQKAARDVQNYSVALADMSKLAADQGVKQALAEMSKQVAAVNGDVHKLNAKKLESLLTTLDKACGR